MTFYQTDCHVAISNGIVFHKKDVSLFSLAWPQIFVSLVNANQRQTKPYKTYLSKCFYVSFCLWVYFHQNHIKSVNFRSLKQAKIGFLALSQASKFPPFDLLLETKITQKHTDRQTIFKLVNGNGFEKDLKWPLKLQSELQLQFQFQLNGAHFGFFFTFFFLVGHSGLSGHFQAINFYGRKLRNFQALGKKILLSSSFIGLC